MTCKCLSLSKRFLTDDFMGCTIYCDIYNPIRNGYFWIEWHSNLMTFSFITIFNATYNNLGHGKFFRATMPSRKWCLLWLWTAAEISSWNIIMKYYHKMTSWDDISSQQVTNTQECVNGMPMTTSCKWYLFCFLEMTWNNDMKFGQQY